MASLKVLRAIFVGSLCIGALLVAANRSQAQHNDPPEYLEQASKRIRPVLSAALKAGYKMEKGMTMAGGVIDQGKKWTPMLQMLLQPGKKYRIVGAGDFDARDVDLRITDEKGKVLAQDTEDDPTATVDFTPPVKAWYRFEMRVYKSQEDNPCVCLMAVVSKVAADDGTPKVPVADAPDPSLKPIYGQVKLEAGFEPDPYTKTLKAGGAIKAKLGGVTAYVGERPALKLYYTKGDERLTISVKSAEEITLQVRQPDGKWRGAIGLNPQVGFGKPQSGCYDIYVGTQKKGVFPEATVYITELK